MGWGVPMDIRLGISWLEKAAAQGDVGAINGLQSNAAAGMPEAVEALRRLRIAPQ